MRNKCSSEQIQTLPPRRVAAGVDSHCHLGGAVIIENNSQRSTINLPTIIDVLLSYRHKRHQWSPKLLRSHTKPPRPGLLAHSHLMLLSQLQVLLMAKAPRIWMKYMSVPVSVLQLISASIYELLPLLSLTMHWIQSGDGHQAILTRLVVKGSWVSLINHFQGYTAP